MKESTAWELLAMDMEANVNASQDLWTCIILDNLCAGLPMPFGVMRHVNYARVIPPDVAFAMLNRFNAHIKLGNAMLGYDASFSNPQAWYKVSDGEYYVSGLMNKYRVLACLWLSLEAQEEEMC